MPTTEAGTLIHVLWINPDRAGRDEPEPSVDCLGIGAKIDFARRLGADRRRSAPILRGYPPAGEL
jgi:hypothetical protein